MVSITPPARGDINWDVPLNAALNTLASALTTAQADILTKVSKTGDSIAGALNITNNGTGAPLIVATSADGTASLGVLVVNPFSANKRAVDIRLGADAVSRLRIDMSAGTGSGTITFGNGTSADVNLYRSAADTLKTDDSLSVGTGTVLLGADVNIYRASADVLQTDDYFVMPNGQANGNFSVFGGQVNAVNIGTVGGGVTIKTGANARLGTATLVAGTVTVANTSVSANTKIFLSRATTGGTVGHLSYTKINGTSFTINSSSGTETSTVDWMLVEAS